MCVRLVKIADVVSFADGFSLEHTSCQVVLKGWTGAEEHGAREERT